MPFSIKHCPHPNQIKNQPGKWYKTLLKDVHDPENGMPFPVRNLHVFSWNCCAVLV